MTDESAVAQEAQRLATKDEASLELLVGMRTKAIELNPALENDVTLEPEYDKTTMGPLDDLRALGRRVIKRWNKELYGIVCGAKADNEKDREAIVQALGIGEVAVIAAVAAALMGLGVPPPIAAAVAPIIVRKFILPAKGELCEAWGEAIAGQG
jgi:hypothetical protein